MTQRSSKVMVTFPHPVTLTGYPEVIPAGDYVMLVEEELLQGLTFSAYRRTASYLMLQGSSGQSGRIELCPIHERDLETATVHDRGHGG